MTAFKIYWTSTAVKQRDYIFDYWNKRNKSTAYSAKLNTKIKERIQLLKTHPYLGKKAAFNNTRTLSLGHYSIFYKTIELNIFIVAFWDNRQDPGKLIRFLRKD
jgi:plasmid stabilization system protein ParE